MRLPSDGRADQLHTAARRPSRLSRGEDAGALHAVRRPGSPGTGAAAQQGRQALAFLGGLFHTGQEAAHRLRRVARSPRQPTAFRARSDRVQAGETEGDRLLEPAPRRGRHLRRARETRARRRAQPPDPEHADVLALQPRELLRALLLGARRRRGGDGRLRLPPDRARDPRGVALLEQLLPEPGSWRADGCVRPLLPPLRRSQVHQARHPRVPEEPRRLPAAARGEPTRNPGQGALRRRHRLPDLRPARPGARAAGSARHVGDVGTHRASAPCRRVLASGGAARDGPARGGALVRDRATRRVALRADRAARRPGEALRLADRLEARQLLEPGHAVRARIGALPAREPGGRRGVPGTC